MVEELGLSPSDWGLLGAIESEAQRIWQETGQDVYAYLVAKAAKKLDQAATRGLNLNPKGGRPNKHAAKLYRAKRPKKEVLMPHGLDNWPARAYVPYEP